MATIMDTLNEGWRIHQTGKVQEAERHYRQVLAAQPGNPSAWCYLGMALHDQQRYEEAVAAYRRAIDAKPDFHIAMNNLGNTLRLMRRLDSAVATFDKAIAIKPDYLIAYKNKATSLCWEGRVAEALKTYEEAVKYGPEDADIHKHIGIMRLLLGDFAGGWPEYEWRWKTGEIKLPKLDIPQWDGSSLDGKSILLTPEQGLGDTVQFIRYAAWLKQRYKCRVLFLVPKSLKQLLSSVAGIDEWVTSTDNLPPVDYFSPLVHVPGVLGHTTKDFPASQSYLSADEALVKQWAERLSEFRGRKIGIAWRGSPTFGADSMRSIPLIEFLPLARLNGVQFFSLQKGPPREELEQIVGRLDVIDLGREIDENTGAFVETAAVLKNLDLLITCDTAIEHVAGALGVPVWVAMCQVPDWRWQLSGETIHWYPSMRLFRQTAYGDWPGVFERIAKALVQEFPDIRVKAPEEFRLASCGLNRLTQTRDGLMLYNRLDRYIGRSIDRYGEYAEYAAEEGELIRQVVRPGSTAIDAGANIGTHTLMLSRAVGPRGAVLAFEPQRIVFQILCANMALNNITNVNCRCAALGETSKSITIPPVNYSITENFGGVSLGEGPAGESSPVMALDSYNLPGCHFIKVDVEGMEAAVIRGAKKTIEKFRPILYVENDREDRSRELIELIQSLGYNLYWHTPRFFNPNNFYQNPVNEFGEVVSANMLCIHSSMPTDIEGLRKVKGPESTWRSS
jgi:FkbM family methyltransferase